MMKKHFLTALFSALFLIVNAQSNFGVDYFGFGELQTAKKYFEGQIAQTPAESNYYLGEIAFSEGKLDDAKAFYEKGIAASPDYMLNYVGQGKLLIKSDVKAAELLFTSALKKNKKSPEVNVAIVRAFLECGMKDIADKKLLIAKKIGKKSPLVYTLEGDMLRAQAALLDGSEVNRLLGEAGSKYEQAVYFDANYTVAAFKHAQVYEAISPAVSIEKLNAILVAHPDYAVVYRELGKSYYKIGQYPNAIEAFKTYTANNTLNLEDFTQFAFAYYFTDQFAQSIELDKEGLKLDSTNFVLNRLRMYNADKTDDYANGLTYADYFFTLKSEKGSFLSKDTTAYASILAGAGQYEKSLEVYNKLIASDPKKPELYKELNAVYNKMGNKVKAAEAFQKFVDVTGTEFATAIDFYQLGRAYYAAGTSLLSDSLIVDKTQAKDFLVKADTIFGTVCNMTPDSYTGYLWRGHTNSKLDPETTLGLAKPYYEAAANAILKKNTESGTVSNIKDLVFCYSYASVYYFKKDDKENAVKYCNLILALDPTNVTANQLLDSYKTPEKGKEVKVKEVKK